LIELEGELKDKFFSEKRNKFIRCPRDIEIIANIMTVE
jgi:hypothetical protein